MCSIYKSKAGVTKTWEKQGNWQSAFQQSKPGLEKITSYDLNTQEQEQQVVTAMIDFR